MPFFVTEQEKRNTTPHAVDYGFADALRAAVKRHPSRVRRWSRTRWADEFRILRREIEAAGVAFDVALDRVGRVLEYYRKHCGRADLPVIQSAAAFRKCFDWLERLLKKSQDTEVHLFTDVDEAVAADLYRRLKGRSWGRGTAALYDSIKRSVARHAIVLLKIRAAKDDDGQAGRFARWLWPRIASPNYLLNWYMDLWRSVKDWNAWSGSFAGFEFDEKKARFHADMSRLAREYGAASYWRGLCSISDIPFKEEPK